MSSAVDSVVYGPHYRQEKRYKRFLYGNPFNLNYTARFHLALDYDPGSVNPNENVCVIKVVYRYAEVYNTVPVTWTMHDTVYLQDTLKVEDFPQSGNFKYFNFDGRTYKYPSKFQYDQFSDKVNLPSEIDTTYTDSNPDNGIQFWVEWLHEDTQDTLYIDFAEVYDNEGWDEFIESPATVANNIQIYTQSFLNWSNIIFWYSHDEPYTQDAYAPMHIVDSLVRVQGGAPLITEFYPSWLIKVNGDSQLVKYYNMVKPQTLMIDFYPFSYLYDPIRWEDLEVTRNQFQIAHNVQPGFWYVGQGFGVRDWATNNWCSWRRPDSSELKATIMLALAHGVKGLMFWNYDSYNTNLCNEPGYFDCIVGLPPSYTKSDLWYLIKNNFVPRLKGKLGKTLLSINYIGDYLQLQYFTPTQNPVPNPPSYDYLTLGLNQPAEDMNWHAGFLDDSLNYDNKYFLLVNLLPNINKSVQLGVEQPVPGYYNYRFRNVEGIFDTTFNDEITYTVTHPMGEGYLYQVAPVIKYGGFLIANDTTNTDESLIDKMVIRDGIDLTINGANNYTINDTIKLEGSGFITGDGYISLLGNGTIVTNRWDKSLFRSRSGNHPMVIWGEYPSDTITVSGYKVYAKYGSAAWQPLATVGDTVFSYTDETVTITQPGGQAGSDAQYKVTAIYGSKSSETSSTNVILYKINGDDIGKRGVGKDGMVLEYKLEQNYPNPFNPATTISYGIKYNGHVKLVIYDILGGEVLTLVDENKQAGNYTVEFDASSLPSGIYFYKLTSGRFTDVKKMILLK